MSASPNLDPNQENLLAGKQRMIHPCNFRYAGRLSNENARFLTALHEKFAISVTNAMELYLGGSIRVKLISLEQLALADYIAGISTGSYILPCAFDVMENNCLIDIDMALILPIIDLLLGGSGAPGSDYHELTEIDEGILESVSSLVIKELERCWRALNVSLTAAHCIKPAMLQQTFPANEKLVLLRFEMTIGEEVSGSFTIALPTPFVGFLLRHSKASQSKKLAGVRFQRPSLRERILDSDFTASFEVAQMRVFLRDFIELKPGAILKTSAQVTKPAKLMVDGAEIFEAIAVRNGTCKAAQVIARTQESTLGKEQL